MKNTIVPALLLILSFLLTCLLFLTVKSRRRTISISRSPEPPGPSRFLGWSIIGLLHIIGKADPHRSIAYLSSIYGPVMSLRVGSLKIVVISSSEAAREVLKTLDHVFSEQTFSDDIDTVLQAIGHHDLSMKPWIPSSTLSYWRLWRQALASELFTRKHHKATKSIRSEKIKELITFIIKSSEKGESVEIARACFITSLNIISNSVFSTDLASYDPRTFVELQDSLFCIMKLMKKPNLANYFPIFGRFLDVQGIRKKMNVCKERLFRVFEGLIDERIVKRSLRTGPRDAYKKDVLDSLFDLTQEAEPEVDLNDIKHFLYDLFITGTETNATTIEWAMCELLRNPEAMANAKLEINFITGPNRYVRDNDLLEFPYIQAIITETLRLHPPNPFLIPRKANSNTQLLGFFIPKDTQILINSWAIGRDSNVWENSDRFEPERFLGRENDLIGKDFEMLPFGAGRRMCPGISLALRIVPHMLASLIYSFEWSPGDEKDYVVPKDLDMDECFGLTLHKKNPLYSDYAQKTYEYFY